MKQFVQKKEFVVLTTLLVVAGFWNPSWAAPRTTISLDSCEDCSGGSALSPELRFLSQVSTATAGYGAGHVNDMQLVGTTLYTGNIYYDPVLDVSDPRHPFKLYELDHAAVTSGDGSAGHWGIEVEEWFGIARYYGVGTSLSVWDLPTFAPTAATFLSFDLQTDLDVVNRRVYIVNNAGRLSIWDTSPLSDPQLVVSREGGGNQTCILVEGAYAYVGGEEGLRLYNIANPQTAIPLVGQLGATGPANMREDIEKVGNLIFLGHQSHGILVINVQSPSSPTLTAAIGAPTLALGDMIAFEVVGNRAFVATRIDRKLKVLDISDLQRPRVLASADIGSLIDPVNDQPGAGRALEVEVDPVRRVVFVGGELAVNLYDASDFLPCLKP